MLQSPVFCRKTRSKYELDADSKNLWTRVDLFSQIKVASVNSFFRNISSNARNNFDWYFLNTISRPSFESIFCLLKWKPLVYKANCLQQNTHLWMSDNLITNFDVLLFYREVGCAHFYRFHLRSNNICFLFVIFLFDRLLLFLFLVLFFGLLLHSFGLPNLSSGFFQRLLLLSFLKFHRIK